MAGGRRFVDLHTHSTASDGSVSPGEVVRMADRANLAAVALTDHDTTAGLAKARAAALELPDLRLVEGVEVSAVFPSGTLHILGLGIDAEAPCLRRLTARLRAARDERNAKMLARLRELGSAVEASDVLAAAGAGRDAGERVVGRLHMAEALRRKGYVHSIDEAFAKYLGAGAPAFVDKERVGAREALGAIREAGGTGVLAHPVQLGGKNHAQLARIVRGLVDDGLRGIEAYHTDHTPLQTRAFLDLAERYGLVVTGGSDFHGPAKPGAVLGLPRVPLSVVADGPGGQILGIVP